jgi:hypothetical protein
MNICYIFLASAQVPRYWMVLAHIFHIFQRIGISRHGWCRRCNPISRCQSPSCGNTLPQEIKPSRISGLSETVRECSYYVHYVRHVAPIQTSKTGMTQAVQ